MENFEFEPAKETITEALGISEERAKELRHGFNLALYRLAEPKPDGIPCYEAAEVIREFVAVCRTYPERYYAMYRAGAHVEKHCQKKPSSFLEFLASHLG